MLWSVGVEPAHWIDLNEVVSEWAHMISIVCTSEVYLFELELLKILIVNLFWKEAYLKHPRYPKFRMVSG